jgi:hypothetical protein
MKAILTRILFGQESAYCYGHGQVSPLAGFVRDRCPFPSLHLKFAVSYQSETARLLSCIPGHDQRQGKP